MKRLKDRKTEKIRNRDFNQKVIEKASERFAELLICYLESNKDRSKTLVKNSGLK